MVYFLYVISLVALSQSAIIVRFSQVSEPQALCFWRLLFVTTFLLTWAYREVSKSSVSVEKHERKSGDGSVATANPTIFDLAWSERWTLLGGGVFFAIHLWAYFLAAHNTSVAHCVILFASCPIFVSFASWLVWREALTLRLVFSYVICLAGLVILSLQTSRAHVVNEQFGDIMAVVAAITFAGFAVLAKRPRQVLGNVLYTGLTNAVATGFFLVVVLVQWASRSFGDEALAFDVTGNPFQLAPRAWLAAVLMAVVPSLMGHATFMYCLRFMNINLLSCGKLLEPALAIVTAMFVYGEGVDLTTAVSFGLIAGGVLNLFWPTRVAPS